MADKRKGKKRKEGDAGLPEEEDKISKDEYKVAKWMKKNLPVKKTKLLDYPNMHYFTGSKAVDALLVSDFAPTLFPTRPDVVNFLNKMLQHDFFHRAMKVPISEEESKKLLRRKKKAKEEKDKEDAESSHAEGRSDDPSASPKPTKGRKVRLEFHHLRYFEDCLDAYVWIYDPIPFHYWICGTLIVLGAVGICLFPLWPPEVRKCVYHLSIAAAACLCLIIVLVFVRYIVFCLVWCVTMGRHHLMILPNLTADVGFFASFWPLYQYEYKGDEKEHKSKKKKKDKDSDDEQEPEGEQEKKKKGEEGKTEEVEGTTEEIDQQTGDEDQPNDGDEDNSRSDSGSESSSHKSATGKDFEMVDKKDVEDES